MSVHLQDFADLSQRCRELDGGGLNEFLRDQCVRDLGWPEDVVEQWLYDFAGWGAFQVDYGHLDLMEMEWNDERIPVAAFMTMPTGRSDGALIDENAEKADYWSEARRHLGVPQHWESHGTWLRRPLLIDRALLLPNLGGLQVIEGRTRVGILRGFVRGGRKVAPVHDAWVARARSASILGGG